MALILVGGQTKDIGKTTLVCNILKAFPNVNWIALKITTHSHEVHGCNLRAEAPGWRLWEQAQNGVNSDTARFVSAGARHAFLLQLDSKNMNQSCLEAFERFPPATHIIVESTSAAEFLRSDFSVLAINLKRADFKSAAREQLRRVDAIVCNGRPEQASRRFPGMPVFEATPELLDPRLRALLVPVLTPTGN